MSEITMKICDRCKREIPDESFGWIKKSPNLHTLRGAMRGEFYKRDYDLCTECEISFEKFMESAGKDVGVDRED